MQASCFQQSCTYLDGGQFGILPSGTNEIQFGCIGRVFICFNFKKAAVFSSMLTREAESLVPKLFLKIMYKKGGSPVFKTKGNAGEDCRPLLLLTAFLPETFHFSSENNNFELWKSIW